MELKFAPFFYKESHETDISSIRLVEILAKVKDPATIGTAIITNISNAV